MNIFTRISAGRSIRIAPIKGRGPEDEIYNFTPIRADKKLELKYELPEGAFIESERENFILGHVSGQNGEYFAIHFKRGRKSSECTIFISFPDRYNRQRQERGLLTEELL